MKERLFFVFFFIISAFDQFSAVSFSNLFVEIQVVVYFYISGILKIQTR